MPSRLAAGKAAIRAGLHARCFIGGPSGSGKTRTGLIFATVLAGDLASDTEHGICVFDTEAEESLNYADDFDFYHVPWAPPYAPGELGDAIIEAAHQYEVVMVDSASHFWQAEGGTLDIANGRHTGWSEARPEQNHLVLCLKNAPAHVILCTRSKMEYVTEQEGEKYKVRKLGMGLKQDPEWEYEMNAGFEIDMEHRLTISKSRSTALEVGKTVRGAQAEEVARTYATFLAGADAPAKPDVQAAFLERLNALPPDLRKQAKAQFKATLGPPNRLGESQVADAETLVAMFEAAVEEAPEEEQVEISDDAAQADREAGELTLEELAAQFGAEPVEEG